MPIGSPSGGEATGDGERREAEYVGRPRQVDRCRHGIQPRLVGHAHPFNRHRCGRKGRSDECVQTMRIIDTADEMLKESACPLRQDIMRARARIRPVPA